MTRDEVMEVLRQETVDIMGLAPDTRIEDDNTFADYDAISIDIVTIVSGIMRRLKVNVPQQDLFDVKNLGQLVDVFHRAHTAQGG